ncbi:hypothetical protein STEG23_014891, partial [Scotinomys teguina]
SQLLGLSMLNTELDASPNLSLLTKNPGQDLEGMAMHTHQRCLTVDDQSCVWNTTLEDVPVSDLCPECETAMLRGSFSSDGHEQAGDLLSTTHPHIQ